MPIFALGRALALTTSKTTAGVLLVAVLAFAGSLWLHWDSILYDTDSYYHLAIARAYAQDGIIEDHVWTRLSVLEDGFGDKDFLFHVALLPFVAWLDPLPAGRLALAVFAALLAGTLAWLSQRAVGWWGCWMPLWIFYASPELAWRVVRVRPELLSLLLFLVAIWAMGRGRYRWVGVLAAVYALSYTAFYAFLGVVFLVFLALAWGQRRWPWALAAYGVGGTGLGLVLHPHFPKNLEVWVIQNPQLFARKGTLAALGSEIQPNFTDVLLMVQLGWFLGLVVLWLSCAPGEAEARDSAQQREDRAVATAWAVAALAFGVLYLLMSRFSLYFIPFATLFMGYEIKRRGRRLTAWTTLPGGRRIPLAAAFTVCLLVSLPEAWRQWRTYVERTDAGRNRVQVEDRQALARAIPAGAKVAATWGTTPVYLLWAPQGRYLNVLNPVFMAAPYPQAFATQRGIFEGREPDVPLAATTVLDSDYMAYTVAGENPRLSRRLAADPRAQALYRKRSALYRFRPGRNGSFVLDWKVLPAGVSVPVSSQTATDSWSAYPLAPDPRGRALEGYVDARRLGSDTGCAGFFRYETVEAPTQALYEFAPYGPSSLWLDGDLLVSLGGSLEAVLGEGATVSVTLKPGSHGLSVLTCPGAEHHGFYLLERRRQPLVEKAAPLPRVGEREAQGEMGEGIVRVPTEGTPS